MRPYGDTVWLLTVTVGDRLGLGAGLVSVMQSILFSNIVQIL